LSRIRAESGCHDDRFFSLGFAFVALHIYDWAQDVKSVFGRPHSALQPKPPVAPYPTQPPVLMQQPVFDSYMDQIVNGDNPWYESQKMMEEVPWRS
jgi:hypothetical protein